MQKIIDLCEPGTEMASAYVNAKTAILLKCAKGHTRSIIPSNLVSKGNGRTCKECEGKVITKNTEQFSRQVQELNSKLTLISEYESAKTPVTIKCSCGHEWKVLPTNFLSRESDRRCSSCDKKSYAKPLVQVNAELLALYPYLEIVEYINSNVHAHILDKRCGTIFEAYIGNIIDKRKWKCPTCNPCSSTQETEIVEYIRKRYTGWIELHDRHILGGKELDIVLPDLGWAIEFNGTYYHSKYSAEYHQNKSVLAERNGFQVFHIWDTDYINKPEIIKAKLDTILGLNYKIYARNCKVMKINWPKEFLEDNHIQGAGSPSSLNYGLFYKDELVSVMTFSKAKFNNYAEYELVRFCSLSGISVVGAASKLFAFANLTSVFSYSSYDLGSGGIYKKLGFTYHGLTKPGYFYVKGYVRRSRAMSTKEHLFKEFGEQEGTEEEILSRYGYFKVYNAGSKIWIK